MKSFYERALPHFQPGSGNYFVTFRLANSLPLQIVTALKQELEISLKALRNSGRSQEETNKLSDLKFRKSFYAYDKYLDSCSHGETWLKDEQIARLNYDEILNLNSENVKIICFCIMPNHIHLLMQIMKISGNSSLVKEMQVHPGSRDSEYILTHLLKILKGRTARMCNLLLGRTGKFWQHESYDRVVRDQAELKRIINYILQNPVKAGLCKKWTEWKWSYLHPDYLHQET